MRSVLIAGGGKIGATIAAMLRSTGDYAVVIADRDRALLDSLARDGFDVVAVDLADQSALTNVLAGHYAVVSAAPFFLTGSVAEAAVAAGVHYLDLTEDVATTKKVMGLAHGATSALIPQCGLAPGFISIVGYDLGRGFDSLDSLRLRVGALPQYPSNALNYNLTWSTDGVINEYCEPCEAIVDGALREVTALQDLEEFSLDGVRYEAFNTSGGLGTLCETLKGKVRTLNYRTVRYPGHCAIMKALLDDLRLRDRRDVLKDILERAVPATMQDVVVILVTVAGTKDGRFLQETYANKVYARTWGDETFSAIQVTTAAAICAVLDMLANGDVPSAGFIRQEDIELEAFLANRFGSVFQTAAEAVQPSTFNDVGRQAAL
ncbi:MAG: saccharopine dehydrogenase C-terminal domain-containing protein [Pseudomonadota bacterium]